MARKLINRLTPTLVKKCLEGKINTVGDIISYHRSYSIKKKSIPLPVLYKFIVKGIDISILNVLEDPENVPDSEIGFFYYDVPGAVLRGRLFKFTYDEIRQKTIGQRLNKWNKTQSEKYDRIFRHGASKDGSGNGKESSF
jgi:hypothetical protein